MAGEIGGVLAASFGDAVAEVAAGLQETLVAVRSRDGGGSGTVWRRDGTVVTNNHVVPGDRAELVTWDERSFPARVIARSPANDLAVLHVDAVGLAPATVGDSRKLRVGELVFAAGNPWGQRGVVTAGVIVSVGRATVENRVPLPEAILADARLAPGNSGGPLADARGRVIGINAMIADGMAVAVPAHLVDSMLADGRAAPGALGIGGQAVPLPPAIAASYGLDAGAGLLITAVAEASPAARAGLIPGDIILGVNGEPEGIHGIARQLRGLTAGKSVQVDVLRGRERCRFEAVPAARE